MPDVSSRTTSPSPRDSIRERNESRNEFRRYQRVSSSVLPMSPLRLIAAGNCMFLDPIDGGIRCADSIRSMAFKCACTIRHNR